MDPHTLEKVEFDRIRRLLGTFAASALGRQMAEKIRPGARREVVEGWLDQVREMIEAAAGLGLPPFGGISDVREAVRSAVPPHSLDPEGFAVLAQTFAGTHEVARWAGALKPAHVHLKALCARIGDFQPLADAIRKVIDPNGQVRDDASARLHKLRVEISQTRIRIEQTIDRVLKDRHVLKYLRYPQATFHDDRYVLPLSAEHRGRVPGIVHRSSDSGATLFVEPAAAVELNNRIIALKADEQAEIGRLLWHLTHQVHLNQAEILKTLDALAVLDLVAAKVRFARAYEMTCPELSPDPRLRLRQARHPLLIELSRQAREKGESRPVVPIDVRLGEDFDVLVITGPNTGGKTVALKTVALLCAMALAGLPIPAAEGSSVPLYDDILVDIGDEQSLQQSLSTFSSHLTQIMTILKRARPGTLMLLDELGAGTDPDEGAAIGVAVIEELLRRRCPAMITTHLGALKAVAFREGRAENASVEFDVETLRPTYRLLIGEPGNSNAINIAQRLGLPQTIIEAARRHLSDAHQQLTRAISGTLQSRRRAEQARAEAESAKVEAERARQEAERQRIALLEQRAAFEQWIAAVTALRAGDKVHVRRFDREGRIVRVLLHKQLAVVAVGAMEMEIPLTELSPGP
ncbi:MAG: DNA strand exchange inhibitor protein [Phycisphaerae bacterium]|jgi:DNA mismatch repair protein MutS2